MLGSVLILHVALLDWSMATSFATVASPLRHRGIAQTASVPKQLSKHQLGLRGGSTNGDGTSIGQSSAVVAPLQAMSDETTQTDTHNATPESDVTKGQFVEQPEPLADGSSSTDVSRMGPNAPPPGLLRSKFPSIPWHSVPNWLTVLRCLAIPALIATFYAPRQHVATSLLFAAASATDYFDGYLARRWDVTSPFGAFLDPVADKLMVSTALILLSGRYGARVAIPTSIILARELAVSALREWMASRGLRDVVQVGYQGKIKTALTMVALTFLLIVPVEGAGVLHKLLGPSLLMLYLCSAITVSSGIVYFRAAAPMLAPSGTAV